MAVLPKAPDAEIAVLGSALLDPEAARRAVEQLEPSDFDDDGRQAVFVAIRTLVTHGQPVDRVTVYETLQDLGLVGRAPSTLLVDMEGAVPTAVHAPHYISRVKECGRARSIWGAAKQLAHQMSQNGTNPEKFLKDFYEMVGTPGAGRRAAGAELPRLDSPIQVLRAMRDHGEPISTGLPVLDERLRGGMRPGGAMAVSGTAGAGKTCLVLQMGLAAAEAGCAVACLTPDEGREAAIIRLGQQLGHDRDDVERGNDSVLAMIERDLAARIIVFPDADAEEVTLDSVVEAFVAAYPERRKVLLIDSIQTVRTRRPGGDQLSLRERIMENARTARRLAVTHGLVALYTSEMNRAAYRWKRPEDRASDLSAPAEARIEYSADVLLTMRAQEDDSGLVEVRIPKNRLGDKTGLALRLDRARARFEVMESDVAEALRGAAQERKIELATAKIRQALKADPGLNRADLQHRVGMKGEVFVRALQGLKDRGFVYVKRDGRTTRHFLQGVPQ